MAGTEDNDEIISTDGLEKSDSKQRKHKKSKKKKKKEKKSGKEPEVSISSTENKNDDADALDKVNQKGKALVGNTDVPGNIDMNSDGNGKDNEKIGDVQKERKNKKKKGKKKKEKNSKKGNKTDNDGALESVDAAGETSTSDKRNTKSATVDNDDSDSDDELLAAAAQWADDDEEENDEKLSSSERASASPKQVYSLHITQLPYDSNDMDIRKIFAEQGCSITSIRLVYDHDTEGQKTVFRGVAFVDLLDATSYQKALKLHHRVSVRGRRLNIRPCKSKEELAEIVAKTQTLVQEKIRQQRSGTTTPTVEKTTTPRSSKTANHNASSCSPSPSASKSPKSKGNNNSKKRKNDQSDKKEKKPRLDKDGKAVKLTKKERNRRAAIIMQKRRRQKK